jgi:hypothetical protein
LIKKGSSLWNAMKIFEMIRIPDGLRKILNVL